MSNIHANKTEPPCKKREYLLPNNVAPLALICAVTLAVWLYLEIDVTAISAIVSALILALCYCLVATRKNGQTTFLGVALLLFFGGGFAAVTIPTLWSLLVHFLAIAVIRIRLRATEAITLSLLLSLVFCIGMVQWNRNYGRLPTAEIMALREEFAPVNLRSKLKYEKDHDPITISPMQKELDGLANDVLDPQLKELKMVVSSEDPYEQLDQANFFLKALHGRQAHVFANREGFGVWRMNPIPNRPRVEPPELRNLPFGRLDNYYTEAGYRWSRRSWVESIDGLYWLLGKENRNLPTGPTRDTESFLSWVHSVGVVDFFQPQGLGVKLGKDKWAGFVSHGFHVNPIEVDGGMQFILKNLQLVSMLKYDRPQVYELEHLPRMDQLSQNDIATRDLDLFEMVALAKLQKGVDIVSHTNHENIRMLGALRAEKICLECHSTKPKGLLGAFSYEIEKTGIPPRQ